MATTLAYGRSRPAEGDLASTWMSSLESNVTLDDAHDHDGSDSARLPISSITKSTMTIAGSGYTDNGNGNYSKTFTSGSGSDLIPATITEINNHLIAFYITATGERIHPSVERVSATSFTMRVNQQLALTAVFM